MQSHLHIKILRVPDAVIVSVALIVEVVMVGAVVVVVMAAIVDAVVVDVEWVLVGLLENATALPFGLDDFWLGVSFFTKTCVILEENNCKMYYLHVLTFSSHS